MHLYLIIFSFLTLVTSSRDVIAQPKFFSLYTNLSGNTCRKFIDDKVTGAYTLDCPGIQGFRLHVLTDDERSSVNVVMPDKRIHPLDYWEVVTPGFSKLGKKAEWRAARVGRKIIPVAIIVRIDTLDQRDPERPRRAPILAVARIFQDTACVTKTIDANTPSANEQARRFADDEHLPCLSRESVSKPLTKG